MFAVFGKVRAEEEKRRRLVYDKSQSKWYEDSNPTNTHRLDTRADKHRQHPPRLLKTSTMTSLFRRE